MFNKKEYQDKMKGMYDSEGKILKDKKEQHDKLQTEEAELRKKTNQNYLKEQGTLYAQLVKDKTSAEKRPFKRICAFERCFFKKLGISNC